MNEIRAHNLRKIIDENFNGVIARFASKADMQPGQISRFFMSPDNKNARNIGEKIARKIEQKANLKHLSLDEVGNSISVSEPKNGVEYGASGLEELMDLATPRSKRSVETFIRAVKEKRMTDDDWEHLAAIVQRFQKPR